MILQWMLLLHMRFPIKSAIILGQISYDGCTFNLHSDIMKEKANGV